ncbi:hypothetical protein KMW28_17375 [Flammeovirga yaeyamensis]|uniref:Secreted protein n=1 Tax=Flammeovirga yaeyamensis TaxID=367791 RepID=A0AAX1N5F7_9BACT|nr:hypothetical protein [Flammeovirga yaeyamensis]MBB3698209.1 hypothetical protein [Flammeovirga yaeyamensis]NMF34436.1 hypothetical protein [Flammeovirga yaeyamensis]QWG01415.1 hypothetical protein KMW28_17375 [Flammeovirga yaeyamensis]
MILFNINPRHAYGSRRWPTTLLFLFIPLLLLQNKSYAQEEEKIDNSKPTNLYRRLNAVVESNEDGRVGARLIYNGTVGSNILYSVELPVFSTENKETGQRSYGIGDVRARFFHVTHKNYEKTLGAFGYSVDVFVPGQTGIGSDRWMISPGVLVGVIATDWIQFFPIVSYQYRHHMTTGAVSHGASFQVITPIKFGDKSFMRITPIWQMPDFRNPEVSTALETQFNYFISKKVQLQLFHMAHEKYGNTVRIGTTIFF